MSDVCDILMSSPPVAGPSNQAASVVINEEKEIYQRENTIQTKENRSKHREVPFPFYYYFLENSYNV